MQKKMSKAELELIAIKCQFKEDGYGINMWGEFSYPQDVSFTDEEYNIISNTFNNNKDRFHKYAASRLRYLLYGSTYEWILKDVDKPLDGAPLNPKYDELRNAAINTKKKNERGHAPLNSKYDELRNALAELDDMKPF